MLSQERNLLSTDAGEDRNIGDDGPRSNERDYQNNYGKFRTAQQDCSAGKSGAFVGDKTCHDSYPLNNINSTPSSSQGICICLRSSLAQLLASRAVQNDPRFAFIVCT